LLDVEGNTTLRGDLTVIGATNQTSINSTEVLVADNYMVLNSGYALDAALAGGIVVNYDPTTTSSTSTSFTANTIVVADTTGFTTNDIVQVSGATSPDNDGIYVVTVTDGTTLTLQTPDETCKFAKESLFTTEADTAATVTHVNVSVIRSGTDGIWETAKGNSCPLTFNDIVSNGDSPTFVTVTATDVNVTNDLNVDGTTTVNDISIGGSVTECVAQWDSAGAHLIGSGTPTVGDNDCPVHIVTHTTDAAITLPTGVDGRRYTIINNLTGNSDLTINSSETFENGNSTYTLKFTENRATFQFIDKISKWLIV
jgi:hypothetical protein